MLREEVALFVTHSPYGQHLPHYLDCLTRQGVGVILIVCADEPFTQLSPAKGENGILQRPHSGEPEGGGSAIEPAIQPGQRRNTFPVAVCLSRRPRELYWHCRL